MSDKKKSKRRKDVSIHLNYLSQNDLNNLCSAKITFSQRNQSTENINSAIISSRHVCRIELFTLSMTFYVFV